MRPDIAIALFRGNVGTRLAKLAAGEVDATLLAAAGLDRLGRPEVGTAIPVATMLPAPAQGAVGIETRAEDADLRTWLAAIDDRPTRRAVLAERALLEALGADCRSPVAALATPVGEDLRLRAEILTNDGSGHQAAEAVIAHPDEAAEVARMLLDRAAPALRALFAG